MNSQNERRDGDRARVARAVAAARRTPVERDAAALRDAADDARRAGEQARAVAAARGTAGAMYLAAGLAGEAVGDPLLEAVADLDSDAPLLDREQDQQAVVLALLADAAAVVLEQLDGVLADVAVRLDRSGRSRPRRRRRLLPAARGSSGRSPAALAASMTCAKSFTGCVSSGRSALVDCGLRAAISQWRPAAIASNEPSTASGHASRGHVDRHRRAPAVDIAPRAARRRRGTAGRGARPRRRRSR